MNGMRVAIACSLQYLQMYWEFVRMYGPVIGSNIFHSIFFIVLTCNMRKFAYTDIKNETKKRAKDINEV